MDLSKELDRLEKKDQITREAPFFKFVTPGDAIQGTMVTRMRITSQADQKEQIAYILKNAEGLHKVAFNATYPIHRDVQDAVVGQEVRFSFTGTKKSKQAGYSPIKLMTAITRADLINENEREWLEEVGLTLGAPLPSVSGEDEEGVTVDEGEEDALAAEFAPTTARPVGHTLPRRSA